MTSTYEVTHRTEYEYAAEVTASYEQLHLLPRDVPGQRCIHSEVVVVPTPEVYRERRDFFGNRVSYVEIHEPHTQLTVTAKSVVEVDERPAELSLFGNRPWEEAREEIRGGAEPGPVEVAQFVLGSPLAEPADIYLDYALESFKPSRPLLEAVLSLSARINADFKYEPGSTSVSTPLAVAFKQRKGVCQDFAHLGIACLRSIGLPARYVSGYIETDPPPGQPKLKGVDGSHAWLSVLVPEAGWLDVDPTNDRLVNARYVVTAHGRDYGDVPPLGGVIYTEGKTQKLKVAVDVVALSG